MTRIEISDSTYNEVKAFVVGQGLPETAIGSFADATLRQAVEADRSGKQNASSPDASSPDLVERFRQFRGLMRDTTIDEIVADRHRGLA